MGKDLKGKELGVGIPQEKTERARNTVKLTHLKEIKRNMKLVVCKIIN